MKSSMSGFAMNIQLTCTTCHSAVAVLMQVFAGLYTLTKNRQEVSLRLTALRVVLEFLQVTYCSDA